MNKDKIVEFKPITGGKKEASIESRDISNVIEKISDFLVNSEGLISPTIVHSTKVEHHYHTYFISDDDSKLTKEEFYNPKSLSELTRQKQDEEINEEEALDALLIQMKQLRNEIDGASAFVKRTLAEIYKREKEGGI